MLIITIHIKKIYDNLFLKFFLFYRIVANKYFMYKKLNVIVNNFFTLFAKLLQKFKLHLHIYKKNYSMKNKIAYN